jgi:hypothetical protein
MKNLASRPELGRWEHALSRPLSGRITFELMELMRADLFEYLDVLTTDPYFEDTKGRKWLNSEIQRTADRLKALTPRRAQALGNALKAGRIEYDFISRSEVDDGPRCGPFSSRTWDAIYRLWEKAQ